MALAGSASRAQIHPPPRVVRLYARTTTARARVRRLADAVFDGCFLGFMDRRALAALDEAFYAAAREPIGDVGRRYEDEAHIRSGLHVWERAALDEAFPTGGQIVVTAAGAGREVLGLIDGGFDPVGFEPNLRLVTAGRAVLERSGHGDRLRACERDRFPAQAGTADGIVVGWGSYMLIPGRDRRVDFLRGARAALPRGAPLLLSFFVRPPGSYLRVVHAVAAPIRRMGGREPAQCGDALSPNFVHYFTRAEIEEELAAAAFACATYRTVPYAHAIAHAV